MPASPSQIEVANGVRADYQSRPVLLHVMGTSPSQSSPLTLSSPDLVTPSPTIRTTQPKWMRECAPPPGVKHRLGDYDDEATPPSSVVYDDISPEPPAKRSRLHVSLSPRHLPSPCSLVQTKVIDVVKLSSSLQDPTSPPLLRVPVTSRSRPPSPPESPIPSILPPGPAAHSYWFEDGDLVLGVENVFLRVHGERLARCSSAFATLLAEIKTLKKKWMRLGTKKLAAEIDVCSDDFAKSQFESVDGCPFIRLDDRVKDWLVVLEAIYDPVTFQVRPVIFDSLAGALRIATRYEINFLKEWALVQLRATWPARLEQMGPTALPHAAEAIALVRECAIPSIAASAHGSPTSNDSLHAILPAAFYALSVQKWRSGADGGRSHTVLSATDMRRLISGREALQDFLVSIVIDPLGNSGSAWRHVLETCTSAAPPTLSASTAPVTPASPVFAVPSSKLAPSFIPAVDVQPVSTPTFSFCPTCRPALESFWRAQLTPDPGRPWGTWLLRELNRMATIAPMAAYPFGAFVHNLQPWDMGSPAEDTDAEMAETQTNGNGPGDATGVHEKPALAGGIAAPPGPVSAALATATAISNGVVRVVAPVASRPNSIPDASRDYGHRQGRSATADVCVHCWDEHRRLALWRLDVLREAIPRLFML